MASFDRVVIRRLLAGAIVVGLLAVFQPGNAQDRRGAPEVTAASSDPRMSFASLKQLAGSWTGTVRTTPSNPEIDGNVQVTMRVASQGRALLLEVMSQGLVEPTLIYQEDDHLTLVHYCDAGNRPRLIARQTPNPKSVDFAFADISGDKAPLYLSNFTFNIVDGNHHTEEWTFALSGGATLRAHFDLTRPQVAPGG